MNRFGTVKKAWLVAAATTVGVGCGDALEPAEAIIGSWEAVTFTLAGSVEGNVLAAGGHLRLNFAAGGAVSGTLLVPGSLAGGEPFAADMTGTYVVTGTSVAVDQAADTFVRDLSWTLTGSALSASGTFDGVTITVTLNRA